MAIWDFVKDAGKSVFGKAEAAEPKSTPQPGATAAKPAPDPDTARKVAALKAELKALNLDKDDVHLTLRGDTVKIDSKGADRETLSAIAKAYLGSAGKYNAIFEANRPMLSDPDKIYPGQTLRIPQG